MHRFALRSAFIVFVFLASGRYFAMGMADVPQSHDSAATQFRAIQAELGSSLERKDNRSYLHNAIKLNELLNGAPRTWLVLASAKLQNGDKDGAVDALDRFLTMGQVDESVLTSPDFAALREQPRFVSISERMARNRASVKTGSIAITVPDSDLLAEDIDYDVAGRRFFVTSVLKKKIVTLDAEGRLEDFVQSPDGWPMMAVRVDRPRGVLWVTAAAMQGFAFAPQADWGKSSILCYDLKSRKLLHRIDGPPHASFGDMTLTAAGDVILSDGRRGGIYRASVKSTQLERLDDGQFISPQTPAMHPDGRHVFVPDYARGVGLLDLVTKQVKWIAMEGRYALNGTDGLYLHDSALVAVQNGTVPERVVVFQLDSTLSKVVSERVIERTGDLDPTHGVIVGHEFYYITGSGWAMLDGKGNKRSGVAPISPRIIRANLGG